MIGTRSRFAVLLAAAVVLAPPPVASPASPPAPRGTGGAVASADAYATEAGLEVLAAGGNAADAAVATALALAVTFPEAGNLGGGGFAVIRLPRAGGGFELATLDFRETAPAAAHRTMYLDEEGEPVDGASLVGPLAAGVPGSPDGLHRLHERYGELPWARVVEPARRLAAGGFVVGPHLARVLEAERERLARFPETAAVWLPGVGDESGAAGEPGAGADPERAGADPQRAGADPQRAGADPQRAGADPQRAGADPGPAPAGEPPPEGARIALPGLAATLAAYAERGPEAITAGRAAAAVEAASARHGGVLTAADLAAYRAVWRPPVEVSAFGWRIAGMGLPSSGGVIVGQSLGLLERRGWDELPRFGAARAHLVVESWRRAFADRFLLGDPSTTDVTVGELLDPGWLDRRADSIDPARATPSGEVGDFASAMAAALAGEESTETTHLSVADGHGGLVALTTTLNELFGCGLWVDEIGFLNNEMDDFTTAPGRPNLYGLVQGEANTVAPGRRMLSSMSPTIAWREGGGEDGGEAIALGGRGGSRIPTSTLQVLLALIVDGDGLQEALDRPRLHHQWLPDRLRAEPDALSPETRTALEALGHEIDPTLPPAKIQAVRRLPDGTLEAAGDPRGPAAAAVLEPSPAACCGLGGRGPEPAAVLESSR